MSIVSLLSVFFIIWIVINLDSTNKITIKDDRYNLQGDISRTYLDILETSLEEKEEKFIFTLKVDGKFPQAIEMKNGKRIDYIWSIAIDKDSTARQNNWDNDYILYLFLDSLGWHKGLDKISETAKIYDVPINLDSIKIAVEDTILNFSLPVDYLPTGFFDLWMTSTTHNAPNWTPITNNPNTDKAYFSSKSETQKAKSTQFLFRFANQLYDSNKYDQAEKIYSRILDYDNKFEPAKNKLISILVNKGDEFFENSEFQNAMVSYNKVLELNPQQNQIRAKQIHTLKHIGDENFIQYNDEEAEKIYRQILEYDRSHSSVIKNLSIILLKKANYYFKNEQYDSPPKHNVVESCNEVLSYDPDNSYAKKLIQEAEEENLKLKRTKRLNELKHKFNKTSYEEFELQRLEQDVRFDKLLAKYKRLSGGDESRKKYSEEILFSDGPILGSRLVDHQLAEIMEYFENQQYEIACQKLNELFLTIDSRPYSELQGQIVAIYYGAGNYAQAAREILLREKMKSKEDSLLWTDLALCIRNYALKNTNPQAIKLIDSLSIEFESKLISHLWAVIPVEISYSLSNGFHSVWPQTVISEKNKNAIKRFISKYPNDSYIDVALYALGMYSEALKKYPNSKIKVILLYAAGYATIQKLKMEGSINWEEIEVAKSYFRKFISLYPKHLHADDAAVMLAILEAESGNIISSLEWFKSAENLGNRDFVEFDQAKEIQRNILSKLSDKQLLDILQNYEQYIYNPSDLWYIAANREKIKGNFVESKRLAEIGITKFKSAISDYSNKYSNDDLNHLILVADRIDSAKTSESPIELIKTANLFRNSFEIRYYDHSDPSAAFHLLEYGFQKYKDTEWAQKFLFLNILAHRDWAPEKVQELVDKFCKLFPKSELADDALAELIFVKMLPNYKITQFSLNKMKSDGTPDEIIKILGEFKDQTFFGENQFLDRLGLNFGYDQMDEYRAVILKNFLVLNQENNLIAEQSMKKILKDYPEQNACDNALYWIASGFKRQGNYTKAIGYYKVIIDKFPLTRFATYSKSDLVEIQN